MLKTTAQDLAWADTMLDAIKARDRISLARLIAGIHERAVSCAAVRKRVAASTRPKPPFNHTRDDGPFDPCPKCIDLMSRAQLVAFARDASNRLRDRDA